MLTIVWASSVVRASSIVRAPLSSGPPLPSPRSLLPSFRTPLPTFGLSLLRSVLLFYPRLGHLFCPRWASFSARAWSVSPSALHLGFLFCTSSGPPLLPFNWTSFFARHLDLLFCPSSGPPFLSTIGLPLLPALALPLLPTLVTPLLPAFGPLLPPTFGPPVPPTFEPPDPLVCLVKTAISLTVSRPKKCPVWASKNAPYGPSLRLASYQL